MQLEGPYFPGLGGQPISVLPAGVNDGARVQG